MAVAYRNNRTGRVVHLSEPLATLDRSRRWTRVEPQPSQPGIDSPATAETGSASEPAEPVTLPDEPFDPGASTVAQVNVWLAGADPQERARVLAAEAAGRNRRGIVRGPASRLDQPGG